MNVSVFETTIRMVGGLLSAYQLSSDTIFIKKCALRCSDCITVNAWHTVLPHGTYTRPAQRHAHLYSTVYRSGVPVRCDSMLLNVCRQGPHMSKMYHVHAQSHQPRLILMLLKPYAYMSTLGLPPADTMKRLSLSNNMPMAGRLEVSML